MKFGVCSLVAGGSVLALLGAWRNCGVARPAPGSAAANIANVKATRPREVENYGKLRLSFEVNQGQTEGQVKFLARGQGYTLFLTSQEAVLSLQKFEGSGRQDGRLEKPGSELIADRYALFNNRSPMGTERAQLSDAQRVTSTMLQMKLVGANAEARVKGMEELPGKSNYFIGNDPKKWRTNIPTYGKVRMENVYPGVDLVYYGDQGQLEYDFVVQPGTDPEAIKLALRSTPTSDGAAGSENSPPAKIERNGDLLVRVNGGEVRFHKPVIYQPASSNDAQKTKDRIPVDGQFTINTQNEIGFAVLDYDKTKPLVIDPVLSYSTYLGGGGYSDGFEYNQASAIAVDSSGSAYVTGFTRSPNFPTTLTSYEPAMPPGCAPQYDSPCTFVYVTKFSADGSSLVYSTFIGNYASGYGIAVDGSGSAYITGSAGSGFPTTPNAFQPGNRNTGSAFVTKLSPDGSALDYSTYLAGTGGDTGYGIAVDSSGNAYVTGQTYSHDFPTANPIQATNHSASGSNAFVAEINASGSALVYSTYLGGSYSNPSVCCFGDVGSGIAVDASGGAYVVGSTSSTDFPTANAFQPTNHGTANAYGATINAFVGKISPGGSALVYSTYLGGSGANGDNGTAVAVDASGNAYVTGNTSSADFPTTPNAFQTTRPNSNVYLSHVFVTKFSSDGSALIYSTYLGGSNDDGGNGIAVAAPGFAYVTGFTASSDFPTAEPIQAVNNSSPGGANAFVTQFTPDGSALVYSTYLGGSCGCGSGDRGLGIAVDKSHSAYVTGFAYSTNFPTTPFAFQKTNRGTDNAFVAKISNAADLAISNSAPSMAPSGSAIAYTITVFNNGPDTANSVNIADAIPAGTTFATVAISSGSCTAPAFGGTGTVTCTVPSVGMNSGDTVVETLAVNVTAAAGSTITDTATVSAATFDPNSANNSATATTSVISGGLASFLGELGRLFWL